MSLIQRKNAQFFLFMNAFLWGSSYIWSKMLLGYLPRFSILFVCSLGGLITTAVMFYPHIKALNGRAVLSSAAISGLSILSNTFCMLALQYTGSSNTAFIVQSSVVITPLIMAVVDKKIPERKIILAVLTAMIGLFLLTCDPGSFSLKPGDLFALGNAVFFSMFLAFLNWNSKKVEPVHFTLVHHTANTAGFFILAMMFEAGTIDLQKLKTPLFAVLIAASTLVVVITALVQSSAIKFVRPEKATLIYTFEPLTALLLSSVLLNEKLDGLKSAVGCLLVLLSVIFSIYRRRGTGHGARAAGGKGCNETDINPVHI